MVAQNNAPLPNGLTIAGYRIVKKIASGGFSIVYLASDTKGIPVTIKEYLPSSLVLRQTGELSPTISPENLPIYRIGLSSFFDEGRALTRISHPNVANILNFFRANDTVYMVMAYESGCSLQDYILHRRNTQKRPITNERFIRTLFSQALSGLHAVHTGKLLHLDLKPANIYLRLDGTPILLDFGAAQQTLHMNLFKPYPTYTRGFTAPELYETQVNAGSWTDIYSIGAAIFACMTGASPQPADQRKAYDIMEHYYHQLNAYYSAELIDVVRWCLKLDPRERPPSALVLQKALMLSVSLNPQQ